MIDIEEPSGADLIGRRLLKVTAAWHHHGDDEPSLLHLWLHLEGLGPVLFHTPSTGLSLRAERPHGPYAMAQYGSVRVTDDPPGVPLTGFVGQPVRAVREIGYADGRVAFTAGLTFRFPGGDVRLFALVDELTIADDRHPGPAGAHLHEGPDLTRAAGARPAGASPGGASPGGARPAGASPGDGKG
ncbi:hypothetical protein [Kitasatospora sp. NPDC096140]|uniref:hypothetical protein n=1 Tax=Kitasatospora sp. NPDC096140 TaxID=3155425 RepID=UPI00331D98CE